MLKVALDRFFGVVARMEGMTVRHMRVVRSLLVRTGLMVLRRFLVMSCGVLVVFSRLLMMFGRLFGHGIPPVSGELSSDRLKNSLILSSHPGPTPLDLGPTKRRIKQIRREIASVQDQSGGKLAGGSGSRCVGGIGGLPIPGLIEFKR
jgi:hypothetical protein